MNRRIFCQSTLAAAAASLLRGPAAAAVFHALTEVVKEVKAVTGAGLQFISFRPLLRGTALKIPPFLPFPRGSQV